MSRRTLTLFSMLALLLGIGPGILYLYRNTEFQQYMRSRDAQAVVSDLVDNALLESLGNLVYDLNTLNTAAEALRSIPSEERLNVTVQAWQKAYGSWMQMAAFQYGPATQYDYHKRLATWPVDKVLVEHLIQQSETEGVAVDSRFLREEQMASLRGLHAVKFLLLENGQPRAVSELKPSQLQYLCAATKALWEEAIDFEASWVGTNNLSPQKIAVLEAAEIPSKAAYADEFKHPGASGSRYASVSVPLQEIFQDITGALEDIAIQLDELHDGIQSPSLAYWENQEPCTDLLNQLESVNIAYLGGKKEQGHTISNLVAEHDPILDRLIKIALAHTAYRIELVRNSTTLSPEARDLAIRVAESELEKLNARISTATPMVILDPAVRPYAAYIQ